MHVCMNLILCGFPSSGKSYFGAPIAFKLGWQFIDTDRSIEAAGGLSCREMTIQYGEHYFRDAEERCIALLAKLKSHVIAVGGGALLRDKNRERLKALGTLIYLKWDKELLWYRLQQKEELPIYINPLEPRTSFDSLYAARTKVYEQHCDCSIDLSKLTEAEIIEVISGYAC